MLEAEAELATLHDTVLAAEELSLSKMHEELATLRGELAAVSSEVSVYSALNAEIKRGGR